jgi:hypothetical protein
MIQVHCSDHSEIDAIWRMLCHVPDDAFISAELHLNGELWAKIIRTETGDQTAVQPADPPAHKT